MRLLLDTHLLLWVIGQSRRLPAAARALLDNPENELVFSVASLWEIAIKQSRRRDDFDVDPRLFRRTLLNSDYEELPITSIHAIAVSDLPPLHRDPFDRLLIAQSIVEGIMLLTSDRRMAQYPAPVQLV